MDEAVARVAYDESLRLLETQKEALDGVRTRSGTLLAAAALVTTFLGGEAVAPGEHLSAGAWAAVGLFIACAACTIAVLMPWRFRWGERPGRVVEDYVDDEDTDATVLLRDLALKHDRSRGKNRQTLRVLQWLLRVSAVSFLSRS
jgi:hypothetical protein